MNSPLLSRFSQEFFSCSPEMRNIYCDRPFNLDEYFQELQKCTIPLLVLFSTNYHLYKSQCHFTYKGLTDGPPTIVDQTRDPIPSSVLDNENFNRIIQFLMDEPNYLFRLSRLTWS